jgi:hypothetical protein
VTRCIASLTIAALLVSGTFAPAPAQSPPPGAVVNELYTWYFAAARRKHPWTRELAEARRFLEPGLYTLLRSAIAYDTAHHSADIIDVDPFADAQIPATSASLGAPIAETGRVLVPVRLGYGRGTVRTVRVSVRRTGAAWYVADIIGEGGSLRDLLVTNFRRVHAAPAGATRP